MNGNGKATGAEGESKDCGGGERELRATRSTRNATRDWDADGLRQYGSILEDRAVTLASIFLCRVDTESYESAAWEDADCIMTNHILPKSLPWYKPRIPLLRSLPRDIEDMQGVWNATDDGEGGCYRSHINSGPFGYGMFDMGGLLKEDVKGTRADTIIASKPSVPMTLGIQSSPLTRHLSNSSRDDGIDDDIQNEPPFHCNDRIESAARRSDDPGVIELKVKLPLPSLTSCLLNLQRHNKLPRDPWVKHDANSLKVAKSILQGERAEICSSMPMYWSKIDKESYEEPPAFLDLTESDASQDDNNHSEPENSICNYMQNRERRKRKIAALTESCGRKWKISVKVANVSSRSKLINPTPRPMYCAAILPSYVQCGQCVTIESANIKDEEEGLRNSLGSYDCRATAVNPAMSFQAMKSKDEIKSKEPGSGRSRRINVGRSRKIWSNANISSGKTSTFSSMLTGQKLESGAYKRPKDVKVVFKLNGKLICDPDSDPKRTSGNFLTEKVTWSKVKINKAIANIYGEKDSSDVPTVESEDEHIEGGPHQAQCTFDPEDYLKDLVKNIKIQGKDTKPKDCALVCEETIVGDSIVPKYMRPKLSSLPLDDGFLRSFCEKPGTLKGSLGLPNFLTSAAALESNRPLCTVCWTGSEGFQVLKCADCGVLSHRECCLDPGDVVIEGKKDLVWRCAVCKEGPCEDILLKVPKNFNHLNNNENIHRNVQSLQSFDKMISSRKSRRTSRTPTRFKEVKNLEEKKCTSPILESEESLKSRPKCTLCPHSGGAMSKYIPLDGDSSLSQRWTHEVCRIWCSKPPAKSDRSDNDSSEVFSTSGPQQEVCCLCGMGRIHNAGGKTEEYIPLQQSSQQDELPRGLIKCAATGCKIVFHPMCALLSSKLSQTYVDRKLQKDKSQITLDDRSLCQQFSLEILDVNGVANEGDGDDRPNFIPIGFCGLHNQARQEVYGCMPCEDLETKVLLETMKIPYQDG